MVIVKSISFKVSDAFLKRAACPLQLIHDVLSLTGRRVSCHAIARVLVIPLVRGRSLLASNLALAVWAAVVTILRPTSVEHLDVPVLGSEWTVVVAGLVSPIHEALRDLVYVKVTPRGILQARQRSHRFHIRFLHCFFN